MEGGIGMSRRMSISEARLLGGLVSLGLVVGLPIYLLHELVQSVGWPTLVGSVSALILFCLVVSAVSRSVEAARIRAELEARRAELQRKYASEAIVGRIINGDVWQGQTAEQLRDSLGPPVDVDERVLKSKTRHVWKYRPIGTRRFSLRVTLENDAVVGWDDKS